MGLYEMMFPQVAQAEHLRELARAAGRSSRQSWSQSRQISEQHDALAELSAVVEEDVGFLALVLMALINRLVDQGVLTHDQLLEQIVKLDGLDGKLDGRLSPDVARGAVGFARPAEDEPEPAEKEWWEK